MNNRTSAFARIFAALALIVAVVVVIAVVSAGLDSGSSDGRHHQKHHHKQADRHRTTAKVYVVQSGDTLTAIAHKTGITVAEIRALNPEVDPQILITGQTLKLR